ncbi:MAG TPA: regulatory protein RecX [Thermoanaerobaculia bacterium]
MTETAPDRCYLAALRILQYRFNSEAELRRKLQRKQFEKEEIDAALEKLRAEKWLDDQRFAGAFVRTRTSRKVGRLRIARELQAAGVDDETAGSAIAENVDAEAEREALVELGVKRARMLARRLGEDFLSTSEGRNKLAGYLLKQGYDAALVREALKEITVVHHQRHS